MLIVEHRILPRSIFLGDDFSTVFFLFEENSVKTCPAHDYATFQSDFMHSYVNVLEFLWGRWIFGGRELI